MKKPAFSKKETAIGRINIALQCSVYMKEKVNVIYIYIYIYYILYILNTELFKSFWKKKAKSKQNFVSNYDFKYSTCFNITKTFRDEKTLHMQRTEAVFPSLVWRVQR